MSHPPTFRDHVTRFARLVALVPLSILVTSCGGGGGGGGTPPPPPPVTYTATSGVAQKGPLIQGSTVTAQELDSKLSPTGKQYSYQTLTNLGTFSPTSTFSSQYIGLNATGYYFDEVANAVSTGTVTLDGYSDLTTESVLNVNLLTTLAYQRIQHLVTGSNMTFAAAQTQAESEVLAALNIPAASYGDFSTLDLSGSTDGDHILAAISSVFVYGNSAGPLSQLIASFQGDIRANGVITIAATKSALANAAKSLNPATVAANLTQEYSSAGITFTAADITNWIDQDGDGVVGKFKFQVTDATPSTVFMFPSFVVSQVAGTTVSVTAGQLSINGTLASGPVTVNAGDVVAVSPGVGTFPNGVMTVYLISGTTRTAKVSFVSALLSISVTPSMPSLAAGLTQQFKATGTFSDTSTADVTNSVTWTSGTPSVATVISGLATSLAVGSTVVTATSGSVSGSTTLNVTPAVLESFVITPNPAFAGVGITAQLTASGTYSDGTMANVTGTANWTSNATAVATVGPTTGVVTGVSAGSATIQATIASLKQSVSLSVVVNAWSSTGVLSTARYDHTATLLQNGKVLVAGGSSVTAPALASAELYDPQTDAWSPAGSMSTARVAHTATLLPNGKVLVTGGSNVPVAGGTESGPCPCGFASAELYDPVANTWSPAASMSTARFGQTATLLSNGTVLVAGGSDVTSATGPPPLSQEVWTSAEIYDPVADTWSQAGSMSAARFSHTATLLPDGTVLVAGGYSILPGNNGPTINVWASAEIYDPAAKTWSPTGGMSVARGEFTATLLKNGKVMVAGVGLVSGVSGTASAELYDLVAKSWSSAGSLSTARTFCTATLLPDGTVLVAGGESLVFLASAELYDPVANTWSLTGSMAQARYGHTATLLPNGAVLAAGGFFKQLALASAELYW